MVDFRKVQAHVKETPLPNSLPQDCNRERDITPLDKHSDNLRYDEQGDSISCYKLS